MDSHSHAETNHTNVQCQ